MVGGNSWGRIAVCRGARAVGARRWSAKSPADREIVAKLSGRSYEDVERDLGYLSLLDDAPVIEIGNTWKAKSALELLDLFGDRITRDELDRFFEVARELLTSPDPQLEVPEEERLVAHVRGKVRPHSELLLESVCDTLVKLAVRGPQVPKLAASDIDQRIAWFIRDILGEADGVRWLSLASLLPALAEAAPNEFLYCVESSLERNDAPVARLLTETNGSGVFGRCWHAGLLWALEILAWAPQRLARVALLLARLSRIEVKGNWGNTPRASLLDLFRSWIPQTAADIEQRIGILDKLIEREPDVAFDLLDQIVNVGSDTASPSARPKWRDDDSGAGRGATGVDRHKMLVAAADRMIANSQASARRIARLIAKSNSFDPLRIDRVLVAAGRLAETGASDADREIVRASVRHKIYWHRNYDKARGAALDQKLRRFEKLYDDLTPGDPIIRYQWLFSNSWPELPIRLREESHKKRGELIEKTRLDAAREIYDALGLAGIEELARAGGNQHVVGFILARLGLSPDSYVSWLVRKTADPASRIGFAGIMSGLLRGLGQASMLEVVTRALDQIREDGGDSDSLVDVVVAAPEDQPIWDLVASLGTEFEAEYWKHCRANIWFQDEPEKSDFVARRLLIAGRPVSAFQVCRFDFGKVDPILVADILEGVLHVKEVGGPQLDSYRVCEAVDYLEQSNAIERDRLIRLEFGLIPALGYDDASHAATLYTAIMSEPKLFTDLVCALYKPANRDRDEPVTENTRMVAEIAWRVLHECSRQPATAADGSIDHSAFIRFVDEARDLCREADRLRACDSTLGQIIAHAPSDADGAWPFKPARDILERPEMEDMRSGFHIGVRNSRGVTSRAYDEGGGQEHNLAESYRQRAKRLENSHPTVAALINSIADGYERDGRSQDLEAKLRRERY